MSFSAAPSFDPNVGTPATPAQSAGTSAAPGGIGFYDATGNAYTGVVGSMQGADPDAGIPASVSPIQGAPSINGTYGSYYSIPTAGNGVEPGHIFAYDTSKEASPMDAYLDNGLGVGQGWGGTGSTDLSQYVNFLGLDPTQVVKGIQSWSSSNPTNNVHYLNSPQAFLSAAAQGNSSIASPINNFLADPAQTQELNQMQQYGSDSYDANHPAQNMTGMDWLMDVVIPVATAGFGAYGAMAGEAAEGADTAAGISSGMNEMFPEEGATFAGPGTTLTTSQALQNAGTALAKKAALNALLGQKQSANPTDFIKPAGDVLSTFADGGSVDDSDFFSDDLPDPGSSDPGSFSPPSIDPSSFMGPSDTAPTGNADWTPAPGTGSMGLLPSAAPPQYGDPENSGGSFRMSGYDPNAAYSPNGPPTTADASMPASATGASQSVIGAALQKLGYLNDKGDLNLGAALKAGATIASLAVTYLNNKKLSTQGAQLAAAQVQPGQVFTLPNSALSNYTGAPYANGKPSNSNSVVSLRAHGGLMQHHLAMGGPPMQGPLGQPTGAMPPAMMPQGGMNRMPGASPQGPGGMPPPAGGVGGNPQAQPPQMPMGGPPAWQGMAPPPSATPAPANHFAHGGALSMMHAQNYQGHGAVRGQGGGQDDIVDARMAPGEYVFDADTVAALGDGSSEEGARRLDAWRKHLREHKRSAPASEIPPKAHAAPAYLRRG